jgi:hypothetical protein
VPLEPDVIETHPLDPADACQAHPAGIVTLIVPVPPAPETFALVGDRVTLLDPQLGAVCVSVNVCCAIVIVPLRLG